MSDVVYKGKAYDFQCGHCHVFALALALKLRDEYKINPRYIRIVFLHGKRREGRQLVKSCIHCVVRLKRWEGLGKCIYIDSDRFCESGLILDQWMNSWEAENRVVDGPHLWNVSPTDSNVEEFKRESVKTGADLSDETLRAASYFIRYRWNMRQDLKDVVKEFFEGLKAGDGHVRSVSSCTT